MLSIDEKRLKLRKAKREELDYVMETYTDARSFEGCVWDEYYPNVEILLQDFESGSLYVYAIESKIIGAVSVVFDEDLESFDCWRVKDGKQISIVRVVIAREFLGWGFCYKMVLAAVDMIKEMGYSAVRLLVSPKNKSAMSIYKRLGFEYYFIAEAHEEEFWLCEKVLN